MSSPADQNAGSNVNKNLKKTKDKAQLRRAMTKGEITVMNKIENSFKYFSD